MRTGGAWISTPFTNWKRAVERIKAHEKNDAHIQATQAALALEGARREGSVIQQLQSRKSKMNEEQRLSSY